jgi:DNA-binding transcriptional regulator GbsR (MarR family)
MEKNTNVFEWTPFTIQMITDGTTLSRKHVRESLFKLKDLGAVRHNCEKNKWYMPEDFAMELSAYESNKEEI